MRQGTKFDVVLAKDAKLTDGFHAYKAGRNLRWTDGYAALPIQAFARFEGPIEVVLTWPRPRSIRIAKAAARGWWRKRLVGAIRVRSDPRETFRDPLQGVTASLPIRIGLSNSSSIEHRSVGTLLARADPVSASPLSTTRPGSAIRPQLCAPAAGSRAASVVKATQDKHIWGRFGIRVKSGHKTISNGSGWGSRASGRSVISRTNRPKRRICSRI